MQTRLAIILIIRWTAKEGNLRMTSHWSHRYVKLLWIRELWGHCKMVMVKQHISSSR
jgi:hypothetical protein